MAGGLLAPARGTLGRVLQLAGDGGGQAAEAVFDDEVVGAGTQGGHGLLFLDGARDDDEGQVLAAGVQNLQGLQRLEAGHRIIRQDQVPRAGRQGGGHGRGSFHPLHHRLVAGAAQVLGDDLGVVRVVFDVQNTQRGCYAMTFSC